jgi:hypothetical protein
MDTCHTTNRCVGVIRNPELFRSEETDTTCLEESAATHSTTKHHAPEE